jgi:hypothetical protein
MTENVYKSCAFWVKITKFCTVIVFDPLNYIGYRPTQTFLKMATVLKMAANALPDFILCLKICIKAVYYGLKAPNLAQLWYLT